MKSLNDNQAAQQSDNEADELKKTVTELQTLNRLAQAISSTMEVDKILAIILHETITLTASEQGSILSLAAEGERQMQTLFKSGNSKTDQPLSRLSDLIGGWVLKNDTSLITDNIIEDLRFHEARDWLEGMTSVLAVPMVVRNSITGIIILTRAVKFTQRDVELITIVANQCGQFLENAKRYQQMYHENLELRRQVERRYNFQGLIE